MRQRAGSSNTPYPQVAERVMKPELREWCAATELSRQLVRHNLATRYPLIASLLARQNESPTLLAISAAIDRGETIETAIASIIDMSPSAIQCLEHIPADVLSEKWITFPTELFWAIDVLHPLKIPQTLDEWSVMEKFWDGLGLNDPENYRITAKDRHERQVVLEYLLRGLCAQGYGKEIAEYADRLVALLPGIETDAGCVWPFCCYVDFVEWSLPWAIKDGRTGAWGGADQLLMRYSPTELIRQWKCWRYVIAALGIMKYSPVTDPNDADKFRWVMQIVIPDFDESVRWLSYQPIHDVS
jgi:hypothetical protein